LRRLYEGQYRVFVYYKQVLLKVIWEQRIAIAQIYATKSALVTTGRPKFTLNLPIPLDVHYTIEYTHPSTDPIHQPNGIRIQSAVLPQYIFRTDRQTDSQTDTQRDKSTHGIGDRSVRQENCAIAKTTARCALYTVFHKKTTPLIFVRN